MILKEATEKRAKKIADLAQQEQDLQNEIDNPKEEIKVVLEPDEEERQKKMAMMKRYYRNRQATFLKQLMGKKEEE